MGGNPRQSVASQKKTQTHPKKKYGSGSFFTCDVSSSLRAVRTETVIKVEKGQKKRNRIRWPATNAESSRSRRIRARPFAFTPFRHHHRPEVSTHRSYGKKISTDHSLSFVRADGARRCARCSRTDGLKRCARCKLVWYCSRTCQREHWRDVHQHECEKEI